MKKDKKLNLKVEFKNDLDISVLDKSFYDELLNQIRELKRKDDERKIKKESQEN